jgi:DNA-3-methyladenine glycosylase II
MKKKQPRVLLNQYADAERYLAHNDTVMALLIEKHGRCNLVRQTEYFRVLCGSIISQQLSTKAADTIERRFWSLLNNEITPTNVLALSVEDLRGVGCSGAKATYILSVAEHAANGSLPFDQLDSMDDEEIISSLVQVKGVGHWTAEMFLMFAMNRPDVFAPDDLGLRNAIIRLYGEQYHFSSSTKPKEFAMFAERWKPFRTVASWYLWRSLDNPAA